MAARGAATNSWVLAGAPLLLAVAACSDPNRDSAARPAHETPAPDVSAGAQPNTVLPPEGAGIPEPPDHPTAEQIARGSASDPARAPNDVDWSGGEPAHGQTLFANQCALCHGGAGAGDGIATPALNPKPRDFRDARFYIDANANNRTGEDVDLARVILFGPGAFGGSREMVGWRDALSENDVRDLIAYIRTLGNGKRTKPDGAPPAAAPAR